MRTVGTPAVVVDLTIVDANIARLQAACDAANVANRPHMKTHKSKAFARAQIAAGAIGLACQKLGEAEAMLDAGITDLMVCTNILGAARCGSLTTFLARPDAGGLKLAADSATTLAAYADAARPAGRPARVMVECDTGRQRAGVVTPDEAVTLAKEAAANPSLSFAGLLMYPAGVDWARDQAFLDETLAGLAAAGLEPGIISSGGTPNVAALGRLKGATEHRSGTSIFNDRMMVAAGAAREEDCALSVYTALVSRAEENRGILDAGSKTLTSDSGGLDGHGQVLEYPDAVITHFSEEHGQIDLSECAVKPAVGEVVRVIPNHVCVVVNMVDRLVAVRDGAIVGVVNVDARGALV
ncbi:MAG: alanine racemase [Pseudomonadota bacterium]